MELDKRRKRTSARAMRLTLPVDFQAGYEDILAGYNDIMDSDQEERIESERDVQALRSTLSNRRTRAYYSEDEDDDFEDSRTRWNVKANMTRLNIRNEKQVDEHEDGTENMNNRKVLNDDERMHIFPFQFPEMMTKVRKKKKKRDKNVYLQSNEVQNDSDVLFTHDEINVDNTITNDDDNDGEISNFRESELCENPTIKGNGMMIDENTGIVTVTERIDQLAEGNDTSTSASRWMIQDIRMGYIRWHSRPPRQPDKEKVDLYVNALIPSSSTLVMKWYCIDLARSEWIRRIKPKIITQPVQPGQRPDGELDHLESLPKKGEG